MRGENLEGGDVLKFKVYKDRDDEQNGKFDEERCEWQVDGVKKYGAFGDADAGLLVDEVAVGTVGDGETNTFKKTILDKKTIAVGNFALFDFDASAEAKAKNLERAWISIYTDTKEDIYDAANFNKGIFKRCAQIHIAEPQWMGEIYQRRYSLNTS